MACAARNSGDASGTHYVIEVMFEAHSIKKKKKTKPNQTNNKQPPEFDTCMRIYIYVYAFVLMP